MAVVFQIHTYVRTYMHTYMWVLCFTYIHTYMHAYMHAYMHTQGRQVPCRRRGQCSEMPRSQACRTHACMHITGRCKYLAGGQDDVQKCLDGRHAEHVEKTDFTVVNVNPDACNDLQEQYLCMYVCVYVCCESQCLQ